MTRSYGTACAPCRRLKIKCISSGTDPTRCDRCAKIGKPCFAEPRRRRPTKHGEQSDAGGSTARTSTQHTLAQTVQPNDDFNRIDKPFAHYDLPRSASQNNGKIYDIPSNARRTSSSASQLQNDPSLTVTPEGGKSDDSAGFTPPSFASHSEDARVLSLDTVLDPKSLGEKSDSKPSSEVAGSSKGSGDAVSHDDPIHLRILNRPSAQHLYEGYFSHFEYNVGFLDPALYTFDYTRQRSSFLFAVLLSVSARVFRPDLSAALRKHAEFLLGKILLACDADIENIWAIVCMYYWKELGDKRGYTLVGYAMRLAASSDWHGGRRSAYTGYDETTMRRRTRLTETEARKLRDQDRVWLYLGSLDRTLSFFTDRPLSSITVAPDLGSRTWLKTSNPWTYPFGDARAMAGQELTDIAKPVHDYICTSRISDQAGGPVFEDTSDLANAICSLNENLITWSNHWAPIFASHQTTYKSLESQIYLYGNQIRTYFNSILLHRVLASSNNCVTTNKAVEAITSCYTTALRVLREVTELGRVEILYYLWDTAHLMIAYAAMVLVKLLKQAPSCPGVSVQEAYDVVKEAAEAHATAARSLSSQSTDSGEPSYAGPPTSTVEAQERLLKAILFRIKADIMSTNIAQTAGGDEPQSTPGQMFQAPIPPSAGGQGFFLGIAPSQVSSGEAGGEFALSAGAQWDESQEVAELTDAMDLSLDTSFIESWFTQAGLLPWDEPGMFKEPR